VTASRKPKTDTPPANVTELKPPTPTFVDPAPADAPEDTAMPTTDPPTGPAWADMLATATIVDRKADKHRPAVDVPAEVVVFVQARFADKQAAYLPVTDADDYDAKKLIFQAAGDKARPVCSATCVPADEKRSSLVKADGWRDKVKYLRVTVGERRGASAK
jgi:hypothetical protein